MSSIRERLQQLLNGDLSHDDFEDWLASASWNMHQHADAEVQRFVGAIELRMAEHSIGHLDDDDLRFEFQMLLSHGCVEPVADMVMFSIGLQPSVISVSSTLPTASAVGERIVIGNKRSTNATRSATGRTVTAREPLRLVS